MIRFRTGYSFRRAYGLPKDVLVHVEGNLAPITDVASCYGWVKWRDACAEANKTPIYGVELAVSNDAGAKRPSYDMWTFLPGESGIAGISGLISEAYENFRYRPFLPLDSIRVRNDVIRIVGRATPTAWLEGITGPAWHVLGPGVSCVQAARYGALRPVLAGDNRYPEPGERGLYEFLAGRNAETQTWPQHILAPDEIAEWCCAAGYTPSQVAAARANALELLTAAAQHQLHGGGMPPAPPALPLEELCRQNLPDPWPEEYEARLRKELDLIAAKGYTDYFIIVSDLVRWAKAQGMLVGPARGSAAGSLACYLLGITTVDPIPHGLVFERFVDINRPDMPDIDIDFPEHRRAEAVKYLRAKYGTENVCHLGAAAKYGPRSIMREALGALGWDPGIVGAVTGAILQRSSGDARAMDTMLDAIKLTPTGAILLDKYPEAEAISALEGHPTHSTTHASAIMITPGPTVRWAGQDVRGQTLMLDKKDAEALDLLKVDVLGLAQCSILEYACKLAGVAPESLYALPLDDQGALNVFRRHELGGIFQFTGTAVRSLANSVTIEAFEDIVALTALARPGPLASGNATEWTRRRNMADPPEIPEQLRPMLEDTYGVVIYQEQVMRIGREVGGLSWEDVTDLRKAMSKSLGKEYFDRYGDRFKPGAIANGMDPEYVEKLWTDLCAYGSWSFNKSHAVSYGLVSYWCAYMKAHHRLEFWAASLSWENDDDKRLEMLREIEAEGIEWEPVIIGESLIDKWSISSDKKLIGPLLLINGVGPVKARAIKKEPSKAPSKFTTKVDSLWPIKDAWKRLVPDPGAKNIVSKPTDIQEALEGEGDRHLAIVGVAKMINRRDANEEINIARRGGKRIEGEPTESLNLRMKDDTGELICIINRWRYKKIGLPIMQRGAPGKHLYMLKGAVDKFNESMTIMHVEGVRWLGEM